MRPPGAMQPYDPRTIAFCCELLHPPQTPTAGPIQRIHNRLFELGTPRYQSFSVTPQGPVLANPVAQPGAASSVAFLADRFQFREELTGLLVEDFCERLLEMTSMAATELGIPHFLAQVVTIRSLVNPRHFRDSRNYLKRGMFGFGEQVEAFGREPQLYGLRLVFPPTESEPHPFNLRIESLANDPRSIFLENQGTFPGTVVARGIQPIEENVRRTYDFVVERALPFLASFDQRQEA